jgi:MFS family permease
MSVAPLVAEIVIVGLQAEGWLALLVLTIFGTDWIDLGALQDWAVLLTLLVVALAYVLGILVDRLADSLFEDKLEARAKRREKPLPGRKAVLRMTVLHTSPGMSAFLEYQRSRERIARGTAVNVTLAILAGAAFLIDEVGARWWVIAGYVLAGSLMTLASGLATARIHGAWRERLRDAHAVLQESKATEPKPTGG